MGVYVFLIAAILLLAILFNDKNIKDRKKMYCIVIGFLMLLIMGLRNISLGQYDVEFSYVPMFYNVQDMTFSELLTQGFNDSFFYMLTKIFTIICPDVHVWIFCISIPIVCSVTYLVYRESKIPSLSFILFLGLNYYGYNFTILRHSVALSFVIIAYLLFKNEKKLLAVLSFILACMFHISAAVFIVSFIFVKTKVNIKHLIVICAGLYISMNMSDSILNFLFGYFTSDRFIRYEQNVETFNLSMFFLNATVFIISYINARNAIQKDKNIQGLFNISTISLVFLSLTTVFALFFRVAMFFGIFNIILLPNTLYYDSNKPRKIVLYFCLIFGLSFYFLFRGINNAWINPYLFLGD